MWIDMKKVLLFLVTALLMVGPSWAKEERRPEDMLVEAFDRLKSHPEEAAAIFRGENISTWDNEFWRANRWFSQPLIGWLGRYEKCGGELDIWGRDTLGAVRRGQWTLDPDASKNVIVIARANTPRIVGQRTLVDYRHQPRRPLTKAKTHVEIEFEQPYAERTFYFVREKDGWRIDSVSSMRYCPDCDGRRSSYQLPSDSQLKEACTETASGPPPSKDERRPEVMLTEAYQMLEEHPKKQNDDFWRAERWFSRDFRSWIARYETCGSSVPIWGEGGDKPAVRDVAIGRATAGPKGMVSGSYPVRDYRAQRRLSRLDKEGASASVQFTYRDRYKINGFTDMKENRQETRDFLFVREEGEWRINGVSKGFGGMGGTYLPSASALAKACGSSSLPADGKLDENIVD
jgi:hypothetical protein